ncbi:MAG: type IV secretion system protein [Acidobacteriota bacterium]|nr:type IV secretion system protein [Acidobacteriota bacterium]
MSRLILRRAAPAFLLVALLSPGLGLAQAPSLPPTTVPVGQEYDVKPFLDDVLNALVGRAAPQFQSTALAIWAGMATVMIVWTGAKMAFSGDYNMWEIVTLVIGLGIPRTMLAFYERPVPGATMSFPELITAQGTWATDVFIGNTWKNLLETLKDTYHKALTTMSTVIGNFDLTDVFTQGLALLLASVIGAVFLSVVLVLLLGMFCLLYAQIIWAQIALAICVLVGPLMIPWLVFPPMAFLFWGWLRAMLTYTFYGVVAGAVFNIFMNVGLGFLNHLSTAALTFQDLSGMFKWFIILGPLIISGYLAAMKVGELSQLLLSGAGSATAGLSQRVRQVAMAAKTGGASLAAGK